MVFLTFVNSISQNRCVNTRRVDIGRAVIHAATALDTGPFFHVIDFNIGEGQNTGGRLGNGRTEVENGLPCHGAAADKFDNIIFHAAVIQNILYRRTDTNQ